VLLKKLEPRPVKIQVWADEATQNLNIVNINNYNTRGLISLWLYKENNKLWD
jgi:hypothetical protein